METRHRKGDFLLNIELGGLVNWNPKTHEIPYVDFLFLTSANKKAIGLAESWRSSTKFGNWSATNPPEEPNHLPLRLLIREKAKLLTLESVGELKSVYGLSEEQIPKKYLVTDTHPSLSLPEQTGEVYLVKPDKDLKLVDLVDCIADSWIRFDGPVDVQIASAYAMVSQNGVIFSDEIIQDSVFIKYPNNPLKNKKKIRQYLEYLRKERFEGLDDEQFVHKLSAISGAIMNEVLYTFAYSKGIEGTISHALSSPIEPSINSILGMGAAALTPAIVGWIEQKAMKEELVRA